MATSCRQIGALVLRIQGEFLKAPGVALTLPQAQRRFGVDNAACQAILEMLVDAAVLAKMPSGAYVRQLGPAMAPPSASAAQPSGAGHRKQTSAHQSARHAA